MNPPAKPPVAGKPNETTAGGDAAPAKNCCYLWVSNLCKRPAKSADAVETDAAAAVLAGTKKRYLDAFLSNTTPTPTAQDILALQAIAGDGRGLVGAGRVVAAVCIVIVTIVVLAIGLRKAPITRIELRAVADHVAVRLSKTMDSAGFEVSSATPIEKLVYSGTGTADVTLSSGTAPGKPCYAIDIKGRTIGLQRPEGVKFTYSPDALLVFSAYKKIGVNRIDELLIDARGTLTLKASLPSSEKPFDQCDQFKSDIWHGPASVTFRPPADVSDTSVNIRVNAADKDALPVTAVLPPLRLDASQVTFDDVGLDNQQWGAAPSRCSIQSGSVDFLQRVPLVGIESAGHADLRGRQCPITKLKAPDKVIWKVRLGPSEGGLFEVTQSTRDAGGLGSLYVDGAWPGRELGKSYLEIVKEDPGLTLIIGVVTLIFSNLWSFAQLLKRWLA
ncbi:hypothetical protein [Bradyrhizobium australafricanum]|uniref:hypothetical protein n=1 Tax=Bradyrhizobium australafricanum TaxID=2821406 RepID=UPI001CE2F3F9|nr:hypothetical protein [Bradyrhizobium australafricanum]MCA6098182.1 hypothetical protein [Bradyrhizobium australafricanum]